MILVYDIGCRDSFEACDGWLEEAWGAVGKKPMVLVGNKSDLRKLGRAEITFEEGEAYAKQIHGKTNHPTLFVEACAIRLLNADKPFKGLARALIAQYLEQKSL